MSGTLSKLLRLMVQGDKEAVVTQVNVTTTPTLFTSQLTLENTRRRMYAYNNSDAASGEVGYGYADTIAIGDAMVIPRGERLWIPVSNDVDVYFVSETAGQNIDIRVEEIA